MENTRKLWKGMYMGPHLWENIYNVHRAGYDVCGAMLLPRGGQPLPEIISNPDQWDKVQKALDETGMMLNGLGNCIIDDPENPHPYGMGISPDPEKYRPVFEFAGKHGITGIQTSIWTANEDLALQRFSNLCNVAGEYGVGITLEFVAWGVCDTIGKARKLIEQSGCKNAKITVDIMHLYYHGATAKDITDCPPELIDCFHLCDMPHVEFPDPKVDKEALAKEGRSFRLFPGETGIDFVDLCRAIPSTALIMPEIPNKARMEAWGQFEYAARTLEACKKYYIDNNIPL